MLALCALASTYATYVVTRSSFPLVESLRLKVFERWDEGSWQGYLTTCSWCAGFWLAGLVTTVTWLATDLPVPVLHWLASAAVTGLALEAVDTLTHARARWALGVGTSVE